MRVTFKKTGYYYMQHWVPELKIFSGQADILSVVREISARIGRHTYKVTAIDKYILKETFLSSNSKALTLDIRGQRLGLLKGMLEINSPFFFRKALEEGWSFRQLKANVLFKIL